MANQIWDNLLRNTTAKDIAVKELFTVAPDCPLKEALGMMKDKKILSLPVIDGKNSNFLGFIDVLDVTAYARNLWRGYVKEEMASGKKPAKDIKFSEASPTQKFFSTPVKELLNYSCKDEVIQLGPNAPLREILRQMNMNRFSSHRVAVTDQNQLFGLITQTDILRFVDKQLRTQNIIMGDMSLDDLDLVKTCLMVRCDRPLIDAISLLVDNNISGLALVDWEGKLVANFSSSDLKGMLPDAFDMFWKPTIDFLRQGTETKSKIPPLACTPSTPLKNVTDAMVSSGLHRIFITKQNGKLEGFCSLSDLIAVFSEGTHLPQEGYQG